MFVYVLMGIEFFMVFMLEAIRLLPPLGKFTTEVNETYAPTMRIELRWSV